MVVQWRFIYMDNVESHYQISNTGLVRNWETENELSPYTMSNGYMCMKFKFQGDKYPFLIHRLVAEYFVPNPENKPQVNHKDGNKHNNHVFNLEWVTQSENMRHASKNGLLKPRYGSTSPFSKHTEYEIHKACKLMEENKLSLNTISNISGVSYETLISIRNRGKWATISSQYNIIRNFRKQWPEGLCDDIQKLHNDGFSTKEIRLKLGLPDTNSNKSYVGKCIRKLTQ